METALRNERDRLPNVGNIAWSGFGQQRGHVDTVLRPGPVVHGEDLESDEVGERRHGNAKLGQDLEHLGFLDNLGFDSRRRKQRVEHDPALVLAAGHEARGRQTPGGLLLDDGVDTILPGLELTDQGFGVVVTSDGDRQIDIASESRLGASRDREGSDQCPPPMQVAQVLDDLAKDSLEAAQ